jgi:hypothetical protein
LAAALDAPTVFDDLDVFTPAEDPTEALVETVARRSGDDEAMHGVSTGDVVTRGLHAFTLPETSGLEAPP